MICNIASDISTKAPVWTITHLASGRFVQCVPAHLVPQAMRQLELSVVS
jgi:hypothetical protein